MHHRVFCGVSGHFGGREQKTPMIGDAGVAEQSSTVLLCFGEHQVFEANELVLCVLQRRLVPDLSSSQYR